MPTTLSFTLASPTKPIILVPTVVNGSGPYTFALDTGAAVTVISPELAQSLDLASGAMREGVGAGGRVAVSMATADWLAIGDVRREHVQVAITDLSALSQAAGVQLDGIIGHNVLGGQRVVIDYRNNALSLE